MENFWYLLRVRITLSGLSTLCATAFLLIDHKHLIVPTIVLNGSIFDTILCAAVLLWSGLSIPLHQKGYILMSSSAWISVQFCIGFSLPTH